MSVPGFIGFLSSFDEQVERWNTVSVAPYWRLREYYRHFRQYNFSRSQKYALSISDMFHELHKSIDASLSYSNSFLDWTWLINYVPSAFGKYSDGGYEGFFWLAMIFNLQFSYFLIRFKILFPLNPQHHIHCHPCYILLSFTHRVFFCNKRLYWVTIFFWLRILLNLVA